MLDLLVEMRQALWFRRALLWLGVAAAYVGVSAVNRDWGFVDGAVPLIVLAQGIAFTSLQLVGPWIATALFVGGTAEGLREGMPLHAAVLLGAAAAGAGLTARAITRLCVRQPWGERSIDTVVRVGGATGAALIGSALQLGALATAGEIGASAQLWGVLLLSNLAGIVVVSPFLRSWIQRRSRGVGRPAELVTMLVLTLGVALLVGTGAVGSSGPSAYVLFPLIVWAALRTGRMGVSAALLVTALVMVVNTSDGRGPFAGPHIERAVSLDAFLVALSLTGLLLAGLELERRVSATVLSEAEYRHRRLIEQLPLVTYMRSLENPGARPLLVSPQTVDLLGYPLETWLSQPYFAATIVHPDDREAHAALNARSRTEDFVRGEYRMIAADGRVVWILDHMSTVRNEAGEAVEQQGFVVDITERKQLEEQLVRAQRIEALGLLAGGVAHDFNNLLTAISGYTQLGAEQVGKDEALARQHLGEVRAASERAAELTRRLLAFGRRQVLDRAVVDLNEIVVETRPQLDRAVGDDVAVVAELDPGLPRVRADRGQLGQILMNLALNARDAMPAGGTLTIRTGVESGDAILTVADTGIGMDEATRARIFEPFFTTKEVGEGTGLGLAMVYGIVQQSDGRLSVESEPGRGTTFRLALPATDAAPRADRKLPAPSNRGGSETVLLVEDEDVVRRLTAEMLERQGYRVVSAPGPQEALEVTEPWDLLLTDVVMPVMSGPALAERLVVRHPRAGVLFTSGYSGAAIADRGTLGADLLEKPFTLDELTRKVRAALDARPAS